MHVFRIDRAGPDTRNNLLLCLQIIYLGNSGRKVIQEKCKAKKPL